MYPVNLCSQVILIPDVSEFRLELWDELGLVRVP